jgi:hypothetical protein
VHHARRAWTEQRHKETTVLGYDYPLLGVFWTMMFWFLWVAWIVLLVRVIGDIFRNRNIGGFAKAFWTLFVVILPWLGVLVYLIAHGGSMRDRDIQQIQAQDDAFRSYVQEAAGSSSTSSADEIAKLASLHAQGVLSDTEFNQQKARLLA